MTIRRLKCSHLFPAVRAEKPADAVVRARDAERAVRRDCSARRLRRVLGERGDNLCWCSRLTGARLLQ